MKKVREKENVKRKRYENGKKKKKKQKWEEGKRNEKCR